MTKDRHRRQGYPIATALLKLARLTAPVSDPPSDTVMPGLIAPVHVTYDTLAIPRAVAERETDLYRIQGFLHGWNRGFQMDISRRLPAGTLAELLGKAALPYDRFMRKLGLFRYASGAVSLMTPGTPERAALDAYTEGVNQAWDQGPLATEYRLLKTTPRAWTPEDSAMAIYQLAWNLNTIWFAHWLRDRLSDVPEALAFLFEPALALETIMPNTGSATAWGDGGIGSNNWVVDGRHTASGAPLLANDPHLMPQLPSIWYEMSLESPELHVLGATLPGLPGVIIGQNRHITWGVTNVDPDVQDLYRIELEADGTTYTVDGEPHILASRPETIQIRGGPSESVACWDSHWGPVIAEEPAGTKIALAWTAFQPLPMIQSAYHLNHAHDWTTFLSALKQWWAPAQNFVYADREGHIGYVMAGQIPSRKADAPFGVRDGNTGRFSWSEPVDFDLLPKLFDPPDGIIVTANNPVVGAEAAIPLRGRYALGSRARRIRTLLQGTDRHTADTFRQIQTDISSDLVRDIAERMRMLPDLPSGWTEALAGFDGLLSPHAVAPTLCYLFAEASLPTQIADALARPYFPDVEPGVPGSHPFPENGYILLGHERLFTWVSRHWDEIDRTDALEQAHLRGIKSFGPTVSKWTWSRARLVTPFHPFNATKAVGDVFGRTPLRVGGDGTTVCQVFFTLDPHLAWPRAVAYMPSYRQVMDPENVQHSQAIHLTGQSGNPLSPYYDDMMAIYEAGQLASVSLGPARQASPASVFNPPRV